MTSLLIRAKAFIALHERTLSAAALVTGFIIDSLTLRRIDLLIENLALITYLTIAALSIIVIALRESRFSTNRTVAWMTTVAPFVMQLVFGALFSAFVVFYLRSASFSASWPFLLFLLGMLIGNEVFRPFYERLTFHTSVFFVALLSYSIMLVPLITHSIGVIEFLGSIVVAVLLISLFIGMLHVVARQQLRASFRFIVQSVLAIIVVMMCAYATNVIPPVPLALKDSGVAHALVRTGDAYQLTVEPRSIVERLRRVEDYHYTAGESVYVWTSVFAPAELATPIVHEWQYRGEDGWRTMNRVAFPISGGRDQGYRGYSLKTNLTPGKWRVSVETGGGLVIGRVRLDVIASTVSAQTSVVTR